MQTRRGSLFEVCCNVGSGFVVAYFVWLFVIPVLFTDIKTNASQGVGVTAVFTVVSVIRGYVWRRLFNGPGSRYFDVAAPRHILQAAKESH